MGEDNGCVIGATATFESKDGKQTRFAKGGGSYLSASDRRLLFGLGADESGKLTASWPGGKKQTFEGVKADRYYRVSPSSDTLSEIPARKD